MFFKKSISLILFIGINVLLFVCLKNTLSSVGNSVILYQLRRYFSMNSFEKNSQNMVEKMARNSAKTCVLVYDKVEMGKNSS